jgi:hypothetical protein
MDTEQTQLWREDITFLADELRGHHANLYHTRTQAEFDESLTSLLDRVPELTSEEVITEIGKFIAQIGDGHTSLRIDTNQTLGFHRYPLRFYEFSDGIIVYETSAEYQQYLGARLAKVGSETVEEALTRLQTIASGDNPIMRRYKACNALNIPEFLRGLHLLNDASQPVYTLETTAGESVTLNPSQHLPDDITDWVGLYQNETAPALRHQHPDKLQWFEFIEQDKLVYLSHRAVRDAEDESLAAFSERLIEFIETHPVERLVIDLRLNSGGNNFLNQSLVHGLICCKKINQPGKLFALIGRHTFSAAMNLAVDLERNVHVLFAGEPTGASPNHYGDNYEVTLPNSGIYLTISMLYWQSSLPYDKRQWIDPQLPAAVTSTDYLNNVDPVLDAVMAYRHPQSEGIQRVR